MKCFRFIFPAVIALCCSCANNDEPKAEIFYQVAEISNGASETRSFTYDDYGRVVKYVESYPESEVNVTYSYPSENRINVHTEYKTSSSLYAKDLVRVYDDEIYLENGRISSCEGLYSTNDFVSDYIFEKKYRHKFTYTTDNHLNVVKWTEWNKSGDDWAYDKPWTWENYFIWENGNLVKVEDYFGNSKPEYTYDYEYSTVFGVQNLVVANMGLVQYYPLQLKGYFGLLPRNLVSSVKTTQNGHQPYITDYTYILEEGKITSYSLFRDGKSEDYNVTWTSRR